MRRLHYVFLQRRDKGPYAHPAPVEPHVLPRAWSLQGFQDDVWRSLAGFADHVKDDSTRCYVKKCQERKAYIESYMSFMYIYIELIILNTFLFFALYLFGSLFHSIHMIHVQGLLPGLPVGLCHQPGNCCLGLKSREGG